MSTNVSIEVDKHTADVCRMRAAEDGRVPHDRVAHGLCTWDTAQFGPWPDQ